MDNSQPRVYCGSVSLIAWRHTSSMLSKHRRILIVFHMQEDRGIVKFCVWTHQFRQHLYQFSKSKGSEQLRFSLPLFGLSGITGTQLLSITLTLLTVPLAIKIMGKAGLVIRAKVRLKYAPLYFDSLYSVEKIRPFD